jgi:hypothetical protein
MTILHIVMDEASSSIRFYHFLGLPKKCKKKINGQNSPFGPLNHHSLAGGNSFSYLQAQRIWRHLTHQVVGKDVDLSGK